MNLILCWALALVFSSLRFTGASLFAKAKLPRTSPQVLSNTNNRVTNLPDTSVASRIDEAIPFLQQVGRSYPDNKDAWEQDIDKLHDLLHLSRYNHSAIRKHVFNLPINDRTTNDDGSYQGQEDDLSLENYKYEYPFGPTYARPIAVGQSIDLKQLLDVSVTSEWICSLQVLVTLFLLSSCVPLSLFIHRVIGGKDTLDLLLRLGLVYLSDEEWVVPIIHLFPLQIPQLPGTRHQLTAAKDIVLMTDLHPSVLSVTTIPSGEAEEGAVMYIGPDSIALVQHLHASFLEYVNNRNLGRAKFRILDVCCGSGVQALAALGMFDLLRGHAATANIEAEAVAIDVNQRALRFTEFNALLNGVKVKTMKIDLLTDNAATSIEELDATEECKGFDILLANPPFIPTPNLVSDDAALSLREVASNNSFQSYGLFSSGGVSGEDCLCAIIQMAPLVLRSDGGLLGIVSEFMNPPLIELEEQKCELLTKMEQWWGADHEVSASGVLFTNEQPLTCQVYAQRRALTDDNSVISLWLNHLESNNIEHVSPGLLFVTYGSKGSYSDKKGCNIESSLVPKTSQGSAWTPHNFHAVEYTMKVLRDLYQF